jgi:uncharacterized membrane protein
MSTVAAHLIFHGTLVLLFGLCLGFPYMRAIKRGAPEQIVHSWRMAHASLPLGAVMMFSVAAFLPMLSVGDPLRWAIAITLILSNYAFCVSTPLAAITGDRGLDSSNSRGLGRVVLVANIVAAGSSMVAATLLVVASGMSL